ncbi:MAG: heat-inducible transcriptional repressor HrcA [Actinomycetota bacterium]
MNSSESLGDRQGQILVAIVREYIRTEDPVGSKHLVGTFNLAVSPATVRNDMAKLEELGYLHQPHTSAGRIPTDLAYRFFVDNEDPARLPKQQQRELQSFADRQASDIDELLRHASEALSHSTRLAAAAVAPPVKESRVKHLDLAWLSPRKAVLVVIAEGGHVEKRTLDLADDISELELHALESKLNAKLCGKTFSTAAREAKGASEVSNAVSYALESFVADDQDLMISGTAHLASNKALHEAGAFARVFEVIERRVDLHAALSDASSPASVRIGAELSVDDLKACSIVVAPYSPGAAIGVIGPTRMEYPRMIAAVTLMAELLGEAVQEL